MEKKTIKCPRCHGILEITNPKAESVLLVTCPNPDCGAKMRVTFATEHTVLADRQMHDDQIGYLVLDDVSYPLSEGMNIVGRRSENSVSTIQLPTDDRSMSRQHVLIQVLRLKNGRVKVVLSDLRNAMKMELLPTRIDDVPLLAGDAFVLTNGDTITLGATQIKYVR